jgi:hypothetical protein
MKTLVILIGTPRGNEVVWKSMYDHLLKPYKAHLALCFEQQEDKTSSLYSKAKYLWEVPKYDNWEQYYLDNEIEGNWREIYEWCEYEGNNIGFSGIGKSKGFGSGAILVAFRHYLLNNHFDTIRKYDRIILTRSDYFYLFDQPILDNEYYWVPKGETYGGITDRFQQFPSKFAEEALNIMHYVCSPQILHDFKYTQRLINIERVIARYFDSISFDYSNRIKTFNRSNVLVMTEQDDTTGSSQRVWLRGGKWPIPGMEGIHVKYIDEWHHALQNSFVHYVANKYKDML